MKRRGFMGLFGGATAAAFVPFVLPESLVNKGKMPAGQTRLPEPPKLGPKRGKAYIFGSPYPNLRVQLESEHKAIQFWFGRFWTENAKEAQQIREALDYINSNQNRSGEQVAWELVTKQDVERLSAAYRHYEEPYRTVSEEE